MFPGHLHRKPAPEHLGPFEHSNRQLTIQDASFIISKDGGPAVLDEKGASTETPVPRRAVKLRSAHKYCPPMNNLGIEVQPLDYSSSQHLFCLGVQATSDPLSPLPTTTRETENQQYLHSGCTPTSTEDAVNGELSRQSSEGQVITGRGRDAGESQYICVNFTRSDLHDAESSLESRFRRNHFHNRLPLYLTGKKRLMCSEDKEFVFTRYHQTLDFKRHIPVPQNQESQVTDQKYPVEHEIFYHSASYCDSFQRQPDGPAKRQKKVMVSIMGIDENDLVEVKITDPTYEEQFKRLTLLIKVYYDTTLIHARQTERVPLKKLHPGMIVVAVLKPYTVKAEFIRARVKSIEKIPGAGDRVHDVVSIYGVDFGTTHRVPIENVFYIDSDFMQVPFMVNKFSLRGCSFFEGTGLIRETFSSVVNTESTSFTGLFFPSKSDGENSELHKAPFSIHLFLGRDRMEQDVNYLYIQTLVTSRFKSLISDEDFCRAQICHCDVRTGNVWLRVPDTFHTWMLTFGDKWMKQKKLKGAKDACNTTQCGNESRIEILPESIDSISDGYLTKQVFVVRSDRDGRFYRATASQVFYPENKVLMNFIDWGYAQTVSPPDVYLARKLDPLYARIPALAFKVRFTNLSRTLMSSDFTDVLKNVSLHVRLDQDVLARGKKIMQVVAVVKQTWSETQKSKYRHQNGFSNGIIGNQTHTNSDKTKSLGDNPSKKRNGMNSRSNGELNNVVGNGVNSEHQFVPIGRYLEEQKFSSFTR